jgi:hypothetical protein
MDGQGGDDSMGLVKRENACFFFLLRGDLFVYNT